MASQGIWYLLLVALLLEGLFLLNQAAFYASISRLTHQRVPTRDLLLPILVAASFLVLLFALLHPAATGAW